MLCTIPLVAQSRAAILDDFADPFLVRRPSAEAARPAATWLAPQLLLRVAFQSTRGTLATTLDGPLATAAWPTVQGWTIELRARWSLDRIRPTESVWANVTADWEGLR